MREIDVRKTQFSVADFMNWQKDGTLNLKPAFQRRSVWKSGAKSYFIDTVVRGLPVPIIYLRQRLDLRSQTTVREVVDGQQRLRTIFSYINASVLDDYDQDRDSFRVQRIHNSDLAGKNFDALTEHQRSRILEYEFSTHVLPSSVDDREVLEMFARLNATGEKLNHQELRNAEFFGELKTTMYNLAHEQLERWTGWRVFTANQISRMREVELTSDLALNMMRGLTGKAKTTLDRFYGTYDAKFEEKDELTKRFRHTMDKIEELLGNQISDTIYTSDVHFFTLFVFVYDCLFGVGSKMSESRKPERVTARLRDGLLRVGREFAERRVPENVLDAVRRASTDIGRRKTRFDYMRQQCDG